MKRRPIFGLLIALAALPLSARADDLNARAAQVKSQLQTQWLPALAKRSPANESASDAAQLVETLSHAHRLGYSTSALDLLGAARVHYRLLRDSRRDLKNGGFFAQSGQNAPLKNTALQAQVIAALIEYARASGEAEPRALAIKTWRLVRDQAGDKVNGGYYEWFAPSSSPTSATGFGFKSAVTHLNLLEAGAQLFLLTRDQSIKRDVEALLDVNEGRFFPARAEDALFVFTPNWQKIPPALDALEGQPELKRQDTAWGYAQASATIARAEQALGLPIGWVDLSRRTDAGSQTSGPVDAPGVLDAFSLLTQIPSIRERRALQIDELLASLGNATPDAHADRSLLDFVADFDASSSPR